MPAVDVVDQSWIGATPARVGSALAEAARWRRWWPDLDLRVAELRGPKGVRWTVPSAAGGQYSGSMEIWLQPVLDGVVAHYFLRLDPTAGTITAQVAGEVVERYRLLTKRAMWDLADTVDAARLARVTGTSGTTGR